MPQINQIPIDEVIKSAPVLQQLNAEWLIENPPNVFVCVQGFEDRHNAIANLIASKNIQLDRVLIISLNSNTEQDVSNGKDIKELLAPLATNDPVVINGDEPGLQRRIRDAMGGDEFVNNDRNHIFLDISVAANRVCLRAMSCLFTFRCKLTIGYTEAAVYHPTKEAFDQNESQWMSENVLGTEMGVEDISPCEEFPGEHLEAASNVVILLPSFRSERSAAVISHIDPALLMKPSDDVIWVLGCPHLTEDLWRRDAMRKLNRIENNAKIYEASTFDYRDVWRILESIYDDRWETSNITLSPLGSKIQAIGVTLFCMRHSDIRVLFSVPKQYNTKQWSEKVREMWYISFGSGSEFLETVYQSGTLRLDGIDL